VGHYPETQAMLVQAALATAVVLLACLLQRVWVCALAPRASSVTWSPRRCAPSSWRSCWPPSHSP
jgi:hypothetical protein